MNLKQRVVEKLREMNKYLDELEEMLPKDEEDYYHNTTLRRACEKTIELAIENVMDIISIIVSKKKLGAPKSEDSLVEIVQHSNVISTKLAQKIQGMKGFRNILIHKYGQVDDARAFQFLTEKLGDFALFEKEIKNYLTKQK